eukprot:10238228-Alexandrium_andersonii.AAC.1
MHACSPSTGNNTAPRHPHHAHCGGPADASEASGAMGTDARSEERPAILRSLSSCSALGGRRWRLL